MLKLNYKKITKKLIILYEKKYFLASYPKSGNTWLRAIITNALNKEKNFSLNDLQKILLLSSKKKFQRF